MTPAPATTLRPVTLADVPALFTVRVATWHNDRAVEQMSAMGITPAAVAEALAGPMQGWVAATPTGEVIGFTLGNRATGEMWVIAVLPAWEGQGIGRRLLTAVESDLAAAGWTEVWLTTDVDEAYRAVGFYRRCGWSDWKFAHGDRYMRKNLAPAT